MFFFFFGDVESFLQSSLDPTEDEIYEREKDLNSIKVDFYLPYGCLKLNYPPRTIIEVKNKLASGTVYQAKRVIEKIRQEMMIEIRAYYIFCEEIDMRYLPLRSSIYPDDIIHVINYKELLGIKKRIIEDDNYWEDRRNRNMDKAAASFKSGKNTLFLGAGLSKSMGLPGWEDLLQSLLESLKKNKLLSINDYSACVNDSKNNPLVKARYLKHFYKDSHVSLISGMREVLYHRKKGNQALLNSVVSLIKTRRVDSVITYNYDDLLEEALHTKGVPYTPVDRSNRPQPGTLPIHHIHGMITHDNENDYDSNVVLSEDDYHGLYNDSFHWANVEQLHALSQTTCFFIGLSLTDPSLRRLLDISFRRGTGDAVHYAFLPRNEYKEPTKAENLFYNMGANVIWYEDYKDLPGMIRMLTASAASRKICSVTEN